MASLFTQGQKHDRIDGPAGNSALDMPSSPRISPPKTEADTSLSQKMLSAVSGSVLTSLLVTPLDVVRVRLQAQPSPSPAPSTRLPSFIQLPPNLGVSACCREVFWVQNQTQFCVAAPFNAASGSAISDCAVEETQRKSFNSTIDGLRKISRNEGILTLWRGLSPTLMMAVPGNVIYFAGYDWLRASPRSPLPGRVSDDYAPLVAGSVARVTAALFVSPIEMLRTRMQASQSKEGSIMRATIAGLKDTVATDGYTSLWRGLSLTLWRDVPFSAFYWWGYEYGRERLHDLRQRDVDSALGRQRSNSELSHSAVLADSFIAGAASGGIAAVVTTPFDVGKTRQQTVLHDASAKMKDLPESRSMPRFLWYIYCNDGFPGLFKGWTARTLKVAPACAIMISSYEIGKKMAGGVNERKEDLKD
nr:hypothetical protein B0A51_00304 [Rachicladosporium sp. CCFEE 5018]